MTLLLVILILFVILCEIKSANVVVSSDIQSRVAGSFNPTARRSCHRNDSQSLQDKQCGQLHIFNLGKYNKILNEMFDFSVPYPQIKVGNCSLSNDVVYKFRASQKDIEAKIIGLFQRYVAKVPDVEISPYNLFHCHLIFSKSNSLLFLFHAFEYPKDSPSDLGFCQAESNVSMHTRNFNKRNALYDWKTDIFTILDCCKDASIFCTRYSEEFGEEVGELICIKSPTSAKLVLFFDKF